MMRHYKLLYNWIINSILVIIVIFIMASATFHFWNHWFPNPPDPNPIIINVLPQGSPQQ